MSKCKLNLLPSNTYYYSEKHFFYLIKEKYLKQIFNRLSYNFKLISNNKS